MMDKGCDTGRAICPHKPQCMWNCHFTSATLDTGETTIRKIKPYPVIPADIDPVPDTWHTVGRLMIGAVMAVLMVFFAMAFFTGLWIWSLLI